MSYITILLFVAGLVLLVAGAEILVRGASNMASFLGISPLISSLVVAQQLIRLEVPLMIGISILVFIFGLDGRIDRSNGILLFAGIIAYTVFLIRKSRAEEREIQDEYKKEYGQDKKATSLRMMMSAGLIIGGLCPSGLGCPCVFHAAGVLP